MFLFMRFIYLRIPVTILLLSLIAGCNKWHKEPWQRVGETGLWSIEVPSGLVAETELNEDAPLQLHSSDNDFFLIVRKDLRQMLEESQPDFVLEDFLDLSIERLIKDLVEPKVPDHFADSIHGLPAHIAQVEGKFKADQLTYRLALIQGEAYIYQVLVWIPSDQAEIYQPFMDRIIESFKLE